MSMFDYFEDYLKKNIYPFHMPGNKRQGRFNCDFTEVEGLDNLYHPEGIIRESLERIKRLYGTKKSYILVNGSTTGILTAITSSVKKGDHILIGRNCHKSVYNAVDLYSLVPHYVMADKTGKITAEGVEAKLKDSSIKACIITSPTYEGIVSNIKGIADVCHKYGALLIVDEAHGSHLKFSDYFPESAVELGADIVIHSTHKTLTSLTGTGLLHICSDRVNLSAVEKRLQTFQTSSPNYIMMASVDECMCSIEKDGERLFAEYTEKLDRFYSDVKNLRKLSVYDGDNFDRGKIVISTEKTDITGTELQKILREKYSVELEMSSLDYCIAMTSINDTEEGFERLMTALFEIDESVKSVSEKKETAILAEPKLFCAISQAESYNREKVAFGNSVGRVSAEYIYAYPPGSPVVAPGEIITENIISLIKEMKKTGVNVISESDNLPISVDVLLTGKEK